MKHQIYVLLLIILVITACGPDPEEQAQMTAVVLTGTAESWTRTLTITLSPTPTSTQTPVPTETITPSPTPSPTLAPTKTQTPLPTKDIELGKTYVIEHGGFVYQLPLGYEQTFRTGLVSMGSKNGEVIVLLAGGYKPEEMTTEESLKILLSNMSADINDLKTSEPFEVAIDGIDGLAVDITGSVFDKDIVGRVAYVTVDGLQYFMTFGNATDIYWAVEGIQAFTATVNSVTFFDPTPMDNYCPVSVDLSFGYSIDSPIMVGKGDPLFFGASNERDYLDQLTGPNGEVVEYTRSGSLDHNGTILDVYKVTYGNTTATLYLDMYNLSQFRIPSGFRCAWEW